MQWLNKDAYQTKFDLEKKRTKRLCDLDVKGDIVTSLKCFLICSLNIKQKNKAVQKFQLTQFENVIIFFLEIFHDFLIVKKFKICKIKTILCMPNVYELVNE